jgi:Fe-S-cluster containining protein
MHAVSDEARGISIEGEWISLFVRGNSIVHEDIFVTQKGSDIKAIFQCENREYVFSGNCKNTILLGEYHSSTARKDEYGNIVLQLIDDSILSGYKTFVYNNEHIAMSPYVWTLKTHQDLIHGTHSFCGGCVGRNIECCCANEGVDMPVLLPFEVENIAKKYGVAQHEFCEKGVRNLCKMKRIDIDSTLRGCYFYNKLQCTIYHDRPIDCRLFPLDVTLIGDEYTLIAYTSVCPSCAEFSAEIEQYSYIIRPLLSLMSPHLLENSLAQYNEKLSLQSCKIVAPLSKIF